MSKIQGEYHHIVHPIAPFYDADSKILVLGSFPSVKSREQNFFYGHPQNRFWKVMAALLNEPVPQDIPQKKAMLLKHGIALFDVIESCDIVGSSDSSIKNVTVNDLSPILNGSKVGNHIFTNGKKAGELYMKYTFPKTEIPCTVLPSTSPANAVWTLDKLIMRWGELLDI